MTDANPEYKGSKFNKDKIMLSLIEPDFTDGLGNVLTYGANKYGKCNWKKGIPEDELIDAMLRHLTAYRRGELIDPESNIDHRDHIAANLMFWRCLYPTEQSLIDGNTTTITSDGFYFD